MRKALSVVLASAMALSLAACSGNKTAETTAAPTEAAKTEAPADTTAAEKTEETEAAKAESTEEPITLNIAYMPNYGSLWAVSTAVEKGYFEEANIEVKLTEFQMVLRSSRQWNPEVLISATLVRVLINCVSTDRQRSSHYHIFPTVML